MKYKIKLSDLISWQFKHYIQRQKLNMIAYKQIDKDGNIIGTAPSYTNLFESEYKEYKDALKKNEIINTVDAIADMIVCLCGQVITKEITIKKGLKTFKKWLNEGFSYNKYLKDGFSFLDIQNEVFDNNLNRIQRDENGNIMKQPALLENGEPNPEAGKIIRKKLNPNLEQFFKS